MKQRSAINSWPTGMKVLVAALLLSALLSDVVGMHGPYNALMSLVIGSAALALPALFVMLLIGLLGKLNRH